MNQRKFKKGDIVVLKDSGKSTPETKIMGKFIKYQKYNSSDDHSNTFQMEIIFNNSCNTGSDDWLEYCFILSMQCPEYIKEIIK